MNKQQEALKLALEALKTFHYAMIDAGVLDRQEVLNQGFTAATAIREALAEQPAQQPVAMRYDFDGYGYKYIDAGSGSDWQTRIKDAEPVYASPQPAQQQEHITDGTPCWCNPVLDYKDPDTGAEVWIHKEPQ